MLSSTQLRTAARALPTARDDRSYGRVRSEREATQGDARGTGSFRVEGLHVEEGATLVLHGDVDADTVPHLQAVLDGLVLLQPLRLVIDLAAVGEVSLEALQMMDRCGEEIGSLTLHSPSAATRANLVYLGRAALISSECSSSASA